AIPKDHLQWNYIQQQNWPIYKRSEVLGMISADAFCIAVAGTHGKTTTSTLVAHILYSANINFTAFLGGISSNYNTNYVQKADGNDLFPGKKTVVLEADEFDRSFHRLSPDIAVITAVDPDHLDIYGTHEAFFEAFTGFAEKIEPQGHLILNNRVAIDIPEHIHTYTYGLEQGEKVNFRSHFTEIRDGYFYFNYSSSIPSGDGTIEREVTNLCSGLPGFHNIENATAAIGICMDILNLDRFDVKSAIRTFQGVKRRFEYVVRNEHYTVIDDYAHHPEELNAILNSVRKLYPNKKLTAIFQPHLFSRTRDFVDGFAESLGNVDELILMEIYPAREVPIEGIDSNWLLQKINLDNKSVASEQEIIQHLLRDKPELLLVLGAGDIDKLIPKIKEIYDSF
ncbi:MAG: UDP-N-acetylmuramate--L-alanine ligase, partial [Bacteroidia bacterium]|nr:UDP-N-acetylmuramate--L-alanine ligase [Bacteroidia bacterium]